MIGELSLPALDTLREDMKLGSWPFPLEIPAHGDSNEDRARIKAAVYDDLRRRGLAGTTELEDAMQLLAKPTITIDAVAMLDMNAPAPLRALVVATGRQALLVVQRELKVSLTPIRETALAASIVEVIPDVPAAPGNSVSVPADTVRQQRPDPEDVPKLAYVSSVMQKPVLRAGQFGVAVRDPHGKVRRLPGIGWFDNEVGRYMSLVRPAGDGRAWLTMAPADGPRIAHRLSEELLTALRR